MKYKVKSGKVPFDMKIAEWLLSVLEDPVTEMSILETGKIVDLELERDTLKVVFSEEKNEIMEDVEDQIREIFSGLDIGLDMTYSLKN